MPEPTNKRHRFKPALFCVVTLFGLFFGNKVTMADQVAIVEGLKNSAAIIFGVVAAWMAIVYPEELKKALKTAPEGSNSSKSIRLFKAFYVASCSLFLAIVFPTLILIPSKLCPPFIADNVGRPGLALVLTAVLLQVWALSLVLLSTEALRSEASTFRARANRVRRLLNRNSAG